MTRYIDVTQAVGIGYLSDWYQNSIDNTVPPIWTDEHLEELTNDFIIIPKDEPTADVQEVKHGKWIMSSDRPDTIICSVCSVGYDVWKHEAKDFKYCPNCGARMDKE